MRPANVELYIKELVLHGFAPGDRYRIGEAVERELSWLLAERGMPPPLLVKEAEMARLDGGSFRMLPGSDAETIGAQVAHAVYGGLS